MEDQSIITTIVEKLNNKEQFGLFDTSSSCYFQDGSRFGYSDLCKAIHKVKNLEEGKPCGTLFELFPETFVGIHTYKWNKHKWIIKNEKHFSFGGFFSGINEEN